MGLFSKSKPKEFMPQAHADEVADAIRRAEEITSGEVRVFIESKCEYVNALDRAWEVFFQLKMELTQERNAVLVYMAMDDKQIAIVGDEGIHEKVANDNFWQEEINTLRMYCKQSQIKDGLCIVVGEIGSALSSYFPPRLGEAHNEIPDEIVFGK